MPATLSATGIHASYPGQVVLEGIDLTLTGGHAPLGLVGPSGVGKTTLVRILSGALTPDQGRVMFDGHPVTKKRGKGTKSFKAAVRFVSQDSMTITDPRETPASRLKGASQVARRGGRTHSMTPTELLAAVGLGEHFLKRNMITLSGGERQRIALATALATRPEILILDEPLTAIDPSTRGEIARTLAETIDRLGMGVLLASHDLELVSRLCPEVVFLADGQLVERGPLATVLATSEHPAVKDLAEFAPLAVQRFR